MQARIEQFFSKGEMLQTEKYMTSSRPPHVKMIVKNTKTGILRRLLWKLIGKKTAKRRSIEIRRARKNLVERKLEERRVM